MADRQPYRGVGATRSERTPYRGGATTSTKKKGPGFVSRFVSDIENAAVQSPGAMVTLGKDVVLDVRDIVPNAGLGISRGMAPRGGGADTPAPFSRTSHELGQTLPAVVETVRHPARHPGNTFLLALPGFGAAARVGLGVRAASKVAKAGGGKGAVVKTLVAKPDLGPRTIKVGDMTARGHYSRASGSALVQKTVDAGLVRAATKSKRAENVLHRRAAKWNERNLRVGDAKARAAGTRLAALGKKLKPDELLALRLVAEEVPVSRRIGAQEMRAARAKDSKEATRHRDRISLTRAALAHIDEPPPVSKLPSEEMLNRPGRAFDRYLKVLVNPEDPTDIVFGPGHKGHENLPRFHERRWYQGDAVIADGEISHINFGGGNMIRSKPSDAAKATALERLRNEFAPTSSKPVFKPTSSKLQRVYDALVAASADRGEILKNLDLMDEAAQQAAKVKAARFAAGATFEKPTAAKRGVPSKTLKRQRNFVAKLEHRFERTAAQAKAAGEKIPGTSMIGLKAVGEGLPRTIKGKTRRGEPITQEMTRARTVEEARVRVASLEKEHNAALDQIAKAKWGPIGKAESSRVSSENAKARLQKSGLNRAGKRSGASGPKAQTRKTMTEQRRAQVEQLVEDAIAKNPESAVAKKWRERTNEIDALRAALTPSPESAFGKTAALSTADEAIAKLKKDPRFWDYSHGRPEVSRWGNQQADAIRRAEMKSARGGTPAAKPAQKHPYGSVTETKTVTPTVATKRTVAGPGRVITPAGGARAERLGAALSIARDQLASMETAAANRVKPTGAVGADDITVSAGAPFIGNPVQRNRITGRPVRSSTNTFGHTPKSGSLRTSTGSSVEHALERNDVTNIVAERHAEAARLASIDRRVRLVKKAGKAAPTRKDDVWVWTDKTVSQERIPAEVRKYLDNPDGLASLPEGERQSIMDKIRAASFERHDWTGDAEARANFEALAQQGKGVFVPRRLLGDAGKRNPQIEQVPGIKAIDTINNAQKAALIYLKVNYPIIQGLSNTLMGIVQQGFAYPLNVTRAVKLSHAIGPEYAAVLDDIMGQGAVVQAAFHGEGAISHASQKLAGVMTRVVDLPARRAAFLHEAGKKGYGTPEKLKALLEDDAHIDDLGEVAQRAKEAIVDYGELSPTERAIVRRLLFVYPWQKGATKYAGHFFRDHPLQAAVLGIEGQRGAQISDEKLGPVPSYLKGVFDVGGGLVNPSGVNPLQTPAQIGRAVVGNATGNPASSTGQQFLGPALGAAVALMTGRDDIGRPLKGTVGARLRDTLVAPAPISAMLRAAATGNEGAPGDITRAIFGSRTDSKTFPNTSDAYWRFLLGGLYARDYKRGPLNQNAAREKSGR